MTSIDFTAAFYFVQRILGVVSDSKNRFGRDNRTRPTLTDGRPSKLGLSNNTAIHFNLQQFAKIRCNIIIIVEAPLLQQASVLCMEHIYELQTLTCEA